MSIVVLSDGSLSLSDKSDRSDGSDKSDESEIYYR